LGSKVKEKKKDKKKKLLKEAKIVDKCKSKCCEKYLKSEKKRCDNCPMFDLMKKIS